MLKTLNHKLTGFRGLLLALVTYGMVYLDIVTANLTGITMDHLKVAMVLAAPQAIKLIFTDAAPKIMNWIADKLG